ncbi:MAG: chloride channel protein [Halothiobacillaceae bacterium]
MRLGSRLTEKIQAKLDRLRLRLAQPDALIYLSALGILSGLLASALIVAFRLLLELLQTWVVGLPHGDRYEALTPEWRFLLPAIGGVLLGLIFHRLRPEHRAVGVGHVIQRFHKHQADMPLPNLLVQFFGGIGALTAGMSGGREGPGVHLGAWGGSILGRTMDLPNNSIRTLAGCGVAAAIAASFNTPLAGVIFAMEVIMLQYTLASFIPVILAASTGALVASTFFGSEPALALEVQFITQFTDVPFLLLMGVILGVLASLFVFGVERTILRTRHWPVWLRFSLAGLATGLIALAVPEVLGMGYDTAEEAARGNLLLWVMVLIVAAKLLATVLTVGLGLPVGLIGPSMMIGGVAGGAFGVVIAAIMGPEFADPGFYALIGTGAMLGAVMQAPLAALTAVMELTGSPEIILPAMVAIVSASLTSRTLFGQDGVYSAILRAQDPNRAMPSMSLWHSANDLALGSVIDRQCAELRHPCTVEALSEALNAQPRWLVLRDEENRLVGVVQAAVAQAQMQASMAAPPETPETQAAAEDAPSTSAETTLDLTRGNQLYAAEVIDIGATLSQALERMREQGVDMLVVQRVTVPPFARLHGIVTRPMLEQGSR